MRFSRKRGDERRLLDDRTTRGVDQIGARLHQAEILRADQAAGALRQLQMDGEKIRAAEQIVAADILHADLLASLRREVLAPGDHVHPQRLADLAMRQPSLPSPSSASVMPSRSSPIVVCQAAPALRRAFS